MMVEKRNILLENTATSYDYRARGKRGSETIPKRNPKQHEKYLRRQFETAFNDDNENKKVASIKSRDGMYLQFIGEEGANLVTKSLENVRSDIRLLNIQKDKLENGQVVEKATVYIPSGKESSFLNKLQQYVTEKTCNGHPKNERMLNSIEHVEVALLEAFWIGDHKKIPTANKKWCEVWLRINETYNEVEETFVELCKKIKIETQKGKIIFPERMVKLINVNASDLRQLINMSDYMAEIRLASEPNDFFINLEIAEQQDWTRDLVERMEFNPSNSTICILDTGINNGNPLFDEKIQDNDIFTVNDAWGNNDHQNHGTGMAGIAFFNDLKELLLSNADYEISHNIESVKILPPHGYNPYELYGDITERAVLIPEIENPTRNRIFCMAVTSDESDIIKDGSPTSWSAAVDQITSGYSDNEHRLFIISAGNIPVSSLDNEEYPDRNLIFPVQEPAQSWNAISVGAYSNDIDVTGIGGSYQPLADVGEISPISATSKTWDSKWPVKPEIVCDGGNYAYDSNDGFITKHENLSKLTANNQPYTNIFTYMDGTSPAAAQASWIAAQLMNEYPNLNPETIRALIIHSADWSEAMKHQFCTVDTKTKGRNTLLRTCGYGIPNLNRAIQCMNNSVNLVIEDSLKPYSKASMNEMHIHSIPWPNSVLESLGNTEVKMKVTLSYFIEPGPGEIGWKDKYRYQSCGLRFDVINHDETLIDFKKRINKAMRGDDTSDSGEGTSGSGDWHLGSKNRDVGSIHSDYKLVNAVNLVDAGKIAIYPVVGWWRERPNQGRINKDIQYSLVVSLSTPEITVDLYTPIITQVNLMAATPTEIEIRNSTLK